MKKIIKIIFIGLCIVPICIFVYFETIKMDTFNFYYNSNKILILLLVLINIMITFFCFKKRDKLNSIMLAILVIYLIIIAIIPCYTTVKTYASKSMSNEVNELQIEGEYRNIFGIPLKWIKNR